MHKDKVVYKEGPLCIHDTEDKGHHHRWEIYKGKAFMMRNNDSLPEAKEDLKTLLQNNSLVVEIQKVTDKHHGKKMSPKEVYDTLVKDTSKVDLGQFKKGMKVELEHKNVTGGDPITTGKIALAHLEEVPDYYTKLDKYVEPKK